MRDEFNSISFRAVKSEIEDYKVLIILIDGQNLVNWVQSYELGMAKREGINALAGSYEGLNPLAVLPPQRHFYGEPTEGCSDEFGRCALMTCGETGLIENWGLFAEITVLEDRVSWTNFYNNQRKFHWDYKDFGPFVFEKSAYEKALKEISKNAY